MQLEHEGEPNTGTKRSRTGDDGHGHDNRPMLMTGGSSSRQAPPKSLSEEVRSRRPSHVSNSIPMTVLVMPDSLVIFLMWTSGAAH